jgi:threonine dehydrogenase-like Zn-dependent dehydrogenase
VLVRTRHTAISPGTELLLYRDEVPPDMALDPTLPALEGTFEYPVSYGYAAVGQVAETGPDVDDRWLDRTVFAFQPHTSHFVAGVEELLEVPEAVPTSTAALLPAVETAVNLCLDASPRIGERAVVFGQGPIGLATTALLADHPLDRLVAVEPLEARRELADRFGADRTFHPGDLEGLRAEFTTDRTGAGDSASSAGADLVLELSGDPAALDDAVSVAGFDGRVLVAHDGLEAVAALDEFDVVFGYPWHGEEAMMLDMMRVHGRRDATLLVHSGNGVTTYRRGRAVAEHALHSTAST